MLPPKIHHAELGLISIKINSRAKRFIIRSTETGLTVTAPSFATSADLKRMLESNFDNLLKLKSKTPSRSSGFSYYAGLRVEFTAFTMTIEEHEQNKGFLVEKRNNNIRFLCPRDTDYEDVDLKQTITQHLIRHIKLLAPIYLPHRLRSLAERLSLKPQRVSITHGKKRLGACNTRGDIQLSYHLMLLPVELSDYVILHELAHLTEMNHSERFHRLLDQYSQGRSKELQRRLKTSLYPV